MRRWRRNWRWPNGSPDDETSLLRYREQLSSSPDPWNRRRRRQDVGTSCQVPIISARRHAIGMSSIKPPNRCLLSLCARWNSLRHHPEASQDSLTRNSTASQRHAALCSALSQRSPGQSRVWGLCRGRLRPSLSAALHRTASVSPRRRSKADVMRRLSASVYRRGLG
jgi:hypothetical protein